MNTQRYMRDGEDPGSARVSRAGEHVLVIASFRLSCEPHGVVRFNETSFRRDAAATDAKRRPGFQTNTRDACAPQT